MSWRWPFCARKPTTPIDRFFYHSFPRRGRSTATGIEKGCKILSLICEAGLLLAPEIVKWKYPHADGSPPREQETIQRRICFTELSPDELLRHAEEFGHFALEFDIDTLKRMGAMPVFYIPQPISEGGDGVTSLGSTLVVQSTDAMVLAMRFAGIQKMLAEAVDVNEGRFDCTFGFQNLKTFSLDVAETRKTLEAISYAITPAEMLEHSLSGLLSCFYPADNVKDNKALAYYRQREWRIAWNFATRDEEVMRRPSSEVIERLLDIDAMFFGRDFPTMSGTKRLAEEALVFPGIRDKKILQMVNRVVVPRAAMASARSILSRFAPSVSIVCIEDI